MTATDTLQIMRPETEAVAAACRRLLEHQEAMLARDRAVLAWWQANPGVPKTRAGDALRDELLEEFTVEQVARFGLSNDSVRVYIDRPR